MVAYSFERRFAQPILLGIKTHTIRAFGKRRHVEPGGAMQLYSEQRTRNCRRLLETQCLAVLPISICVSGSVGRITRIACEGSTLLDPLMLDLFAVADGFANSADMSAFWLATHGPGVFKGVLIQWEKPNG